MQSEVRLLLIRDSRQMAAGLEAVLARTDLKVTTCLSCQDGLVQLPEINPSIVVVDSSASEPPGGREAFEKLLEAMNSQGQACLVLAQNAEHLRDGLPEWVQVLNYDTCAKELFGRLASIRHYQQIVYRAQLEMHHMQRLGRHLNKQFAEVDQDMRLASRLQQEFLPRSLPTVEGVKFATLYRPASWVSGDIYDISRVDEDHLRMYVADVVGHGMAASLLTMFVHRSMQSKVVEGSGYRLLTPSETLEKLNDALADEKLRNSQYVTANYCLLNHKNMVLTYARGGHPYLLLVDRDGSMKELKGGGGLLGLFYGQEFPSQQVQLKPGQKLILYSDGMELAFIENRDDKTGEPRYKREFEKLIHMPIEPMIERLEEMIVQEEGSLNPQDDVTVVLMEITG